MPISTVRSLNETVRMNNVIADKIHCNKDIKISNYKNQE